MAKNNLQVPTNISIKKIDSRINEFGKPLSFVEKQNL
jgi:hypothetical protein